MASVAAATSSRRRRRAQQVMLQRSLQRAKIADENKAYKAQATEVLKDLSEDGKSIDRCHFELFMMETLQVRDLNPDAFQMAKNATKKSKASDGTLPKEALLEAVNKYREFMAKKDTVQSVFQKYNKAGDGHLTKSELSRFLQDQERKEHRSAKGVAIRLIVSPMDLDHILKRVDANRNGKIDRAELLPALRIWEQLAEEKMQQKQMSSCGGCIIL